MEKNEPDSSFDDSDLEVPSETLEMQKQEDKNRNLSFHATSSQLVTHKSKDRQYKHFVRQVNVLAVSPQKSSFLATSFVNSRRKGSSFSNFSYRGSSKKVLVMPLPERECSWRDGLRNQKSTTSPSKRVGALQSSLSFGNLSVPNDISCVGFPVVHEKLYRENVVLRKKREEIYDPDRKERIAEQTFSFSPLRQRDSDSQHFRSVDQFILDQEQLKRKQQERIESLRLEESKISKIIPAKVIDLKQAEETKARVKQKFEEKRQKLIAQSEPSFKPTISKKSLQITSKRQSLVNQPLNKGPEPKQPEVIVYKNKKSEEMVTKKFELDFNQAVQSVGGGKFLSKQNAVKILNTLGFMKLTGNKTAAQDQLVDVLLELGLSYQQYIRQSVSNRGDSFVFRVSNIKSQEKLDSAVMLQLLCEIQQFKLTTSREPMVSKQYASSFYPLVIQRKAFVGEMKKQKHIEQQKTVMQNLETLSPRSNTAKTTKILQNASQLEIRNRLTNDKKLKIETLATAHNRDNVQWIKYQLSELEMLDCTFKPKTNDKTRITSQPRVYDEPSQKGTEKKTDDIEFEKYAKECTFKPVTSYRKQASKYVPVAQGDIVQPGQAKAKQPNQLRPKPDQDDPDHSQNRIIQLNVRISDDESRLLIVRNAQTFEQVVHQFCEAGGLDQEQEQALITVISQNTGWAVTKPKKVSV